MAWHDFMAAAHEGVPVKKLPGTLNSGAGSVPVARQTERGAPLPTMAGGFKRQPDGASTASIRRPSGDVGGPMQKKPGSILDVILGR